MIVVKIEMHSAAVGGVKEIARAKIWNDETGTGEIGNYRYQISCDGRMTGEGAVCNYPRRDRNVWRLVMHMLNDALPASRIRAWWRREVALPKEPSGVKS